MFKSRHAGEDRHPEHIDLFVSLRICSLGKKGRS